MNSVTEALKIAQRLINTGTYILGTGDSDTPDGAAFDCFGFAFNKCYGVKRHRPGFNKGAWASVEDDLNCNSAIEDAQHNKELFEEITDLSKVKAGDLLAYPTFRLGGHLFIGHIGIIYFIPSTWSGNFATLGVIQCHGPNGRSPGVVATDGSVWAHHDSNWPKPEHRTHILRPIQSASDASGQGRV